MRMKVRRAFVRGVVVVAALCCGVAIVELAWRLRGPVPAEPRRYMLFGADTGSALQNVGRGFRYQPHSVIHVATYFDTNGDVVKEYEYQFTTNNLGLVQKADVAPARPSALLLGDSFTEGMGAEPWFEQLAPVLEAGGYQPINGGLLGTGFEQWILLHDDLRARGMVIKKLIVVLISDDYERDIWNFPPNVLSCLSDYRDCIGDEEFYGFPPEQARPAFLKTLSQHGSREPRGRQRLSAWVPATTVVYRQARHVADDLWERLNGRVRGAIPDDVLRASRVRFFTDLYGKSVVFVHVPTREELRDGIEPAGIAAREAIRESRATLFDGFTRCGLTIDDFHVRDDHPNATGYAKIAACVREAAAELPPPGQL